MPVRWLLPSTQFNIKLKLSSENYPIYLSIGTPRLVARNAPIWRLVEGGDLDGVRDLFIDKKASVYDVTDGGGSLITFACRAWQHKPCDKSLDMIRFLVNAGADAGFSVPTNMSAQDYLVLLSFKYLLVNRGKSFIASATTSPVAIDIFRSLLDIDTVDAIEEYLERRRVTGAEALLGLNDDTEVNRSDQDQSSTSSLPVSTFRSLTSFTPLEYATILAPQYVLQLIERGEDAVAGAPLCYAVGWEHLDFIKPMLDAGANVNARDPRGRTALHYVCFYGRYSGFRELLRHADHAIDWNARTPSGQNALDLLHEGVSSQTLPASEFNDFVDTLKARVRDLDDSLSMPGAFPHPSDS
ncbi:hypothetical protein BDY19DRAFT_439453 [Irpex rosettiformis]|uniref:Uncharacterized protein n=1 Tax=Irpex rosettiformis TaxID=378272 RepID=A0ACB8TTX3_9APHY|nr:hypothetical protein BDY19DRAFT_439453 [Irpex rosettiformis]